jgi:hypothetical protein
LPGVKEEEPGCQMGVEVGMPDMEVGPGYDAPFDVYGERRWTGRLADEPRDAQER